MLDTVGLVGLYDIGVAFVHAVLDEDIYVVRPLSEEPWNNVHQSRRALYGHLKVMQKGGFVRVQVFFHVEEQLMVSVHGDDVLLSGQQESLARFVGLMELNLRAKRMPRAGNVEDARMDNP